MNYKHWKLNFDQKIAWLLLDIDENQGFSPGYKLKLNSYDLSVDIELADIVSRIRFEHPQVRVVVISSANERVFCAGANIFMLGQSSHAFKVNFCKFTNETRLAIEDASMNSGIRFLCAANGTTAGGGYELALACDEIWLIDDGNSAVSLPEVPLLGVLPGTGGLTRLVDKRHVRRDLADIFSTSIEGIKGARAVEWKLVDAVIPKSSYRDAIANRARELADAAPVCTEPSITLAPLGEHEYVTLNIDTNKRNAEICIAGPRSVDTFWALQAYRELDAVILKLRFDYPEIGIWILKTSGDPRLLLEAENPQMAREILLHQKRVLKRLDVSSRSLVTVIDAQSNFTGSLAELVFLSDRSFMLECDEAKITLSDMNFGPLPMGNGLTRLQSRFYGQNVHIEKGSFNSSACQKLGLVSSMLDEIDFDDELRIFLEERASLSPDALSGMEANLRFVGPETLETKIFARLSAWQNWIFIRNNATGETGALTNYGKPTRAQFDFKRC